MDNREIKFRVWDTELHIWINNLGMGKNNTLTKATKSRLHVMQFTGLKDKNGVEIYEGDIVLIPSGFAGDFTTKEIYAEIVFGEGEFYTKTNESYLLPDGIWHHNVTVIGNIHQNPELINNGNH